ncbi:MAG: type II secretion system protein GspG [Gemmatimonadota bacterium]|nr:type II secretion system protein GspG [Gemmatimonadota bacterium]
MKMNPSTLTRRSFKKGFTLAEVLVTIAIIAIMAAVLLPALNSQLSKGDTSRIASDLTNLQSGVQAFFSDVRQYPSTTDALVTTPNASSTDINGRSFQSSAIAAWKGPYVSRDVLSNTGGRAAFSNALTKTVTTGGTFLTTTISPITWENFSNLEATLDEGNASTTSTTSGAVRYSVASSTLSFLLMPIQ